MTLTHPETLDWRIGNRQGANTTADGVIGERWVGLGEMKPLGAGIFPSPRLRTKRARACGYRRALRPDSRVAMEGDPLNFPYEYFNFGCG